MELDGTLVFKEELTKEVKVMILDFLLEAIEEEISRIQEKYPDLVKLKGSMLYKSSISLYGLHGALQKKKEKLLKN